MTDERTEILEFWFSGEAMPFWFKQSDDFDAELGRRFDDLYRRACKAELFEWRDTARGRLAEIIVLDQFSRNLFRNDSRAFAVDALALALAQEAVGAGADKELLPQEKSFMYMPFMHSESLVIHDQAVSLFSQTGLEYNLDYEHKHRDIIKRFGRYPHRNEILGRESTQEELEFLKQPGSSF